MNNEAIDGETESTMEFDSFSSSDDGTYTCYADTSDVSNSVELEAKQGTHKYINTRYF